MTEERREVSLEYNQLSNLVSAQGAILTTIRDDLASMKIQTNKIARIENEIEHIKSMNMEFWFKVIGVTAIIAVALLIVNVILNVVGVI
jgi:hypothetical protein